MQSLCQHLNQWSAMGFTCQAMNISNNALNRT
jgi:hypothetical protein